MRSARIFICFLFLIFGFLFFTKQSFAQTNTNSIASPQMDANVPRNQHTLIQAVTIEVLASFMCQLSGIDPINPAVPCLGINPITRQLGYAPNGLPSPTDGPQIGGLVGTATNLITSTYRPIVSTDIYSNYLSDNFGLVKKVHAQTSYGFEGLKPIFNLWITMRNLSYGLLVIAFAFIGLGIMLRVKIDPRTVMSIQNQIPKVIIAIILITFSYAISALMVDLMWVSTYAGVNMLTSAGANPPVGDCKDYAGKIRLAEKATSKILQTPITYFNQVFARCSPESGPFGIGEGDSRDGGIRAVTSSVAGSIGQTINNVTRSMIFGDQDPDECKWYNVGCKVKQGAANALGNIVGIVSYIIIFVILLQALFRIWFNLLKAYIYSLIYVITGPIYIVFGLLPSKPLGFEKWLRGLFVNVAVFPLTAFAFVGARLLMEFYKVDAVNKFIPPLVGNPTNGANFGAIMAFGVILIAPSFQKILQEKMGVKGIGTPGLISAGLTAGAAVVGAPAGRAMKHFNRRDSQNKAVGSLAVGKQSAGNFALGGLSRMGVPLAGRKLEKRRAIEGRDLGTSEHEASIVGKKSWTEKRDRRKIEIEGLSRSDRRAKRKEWKTEDKKPLEKTS